MDQLHLTLASSNRATLFPTERLMRAAVRTVDRVVGDTAAMFVVVDSHVHVWIIAPEARIGILGGALRRALGHLSAAPIDLRYHRLLRTRSHQRNTVGYLLDQLEHHGIDAPPASWTGGCYQDLVGARLLDAFRPRIRQILPRLRREELDVAVRLAPGSLREATREQVRRAGAMGIADAAARALAAGPELVGRARPVTRARRAACHVATAAGIRTPELSDALALPMRTVRRLAQEVTEADLIRAVRLQISLSDVAPPGLAAAGWR